MSEPEIIVKESLSNNGIEAIKQVTYMVDEHAKAVQEVKLCHAEIKRQSEVIDSLNKKIETLTTKKDRPG